MSFMHSLKSSYFTVWRFVTCFYTEHGVFHTQVGLVYEMFDINKVDLTDKKVWIHCFYKMSCEYERLKVGYKMIEHMLRELWRRQVSDTSQHCNVLSSVGGLIEQHNKTQWSNNIIIIQSEIQFITQLIIENKQN